jgi:cyanosortase A-associated protein
MIFYNYKDNKSKLKKIKKTTTYYLISVVTLTCFTIGVSLFIPDHKYRSKFEFPEKIDLSDWQFQASDNLDKELNNELNKQLETTSKMGIIDSRRYFYTSSLQTTLRIDVMYVKVNVVTVSGFIGTLKMKYVPDSFNIRYSDSIGYYALFVDSDRAYLSSCINPKGGTTVTREQFIDNRNIYDLNGDRIVSYLLGTTDLRDIRCIFTIMSLPLEKRKMDDTNNNSLNYTYQKLEKAWINWYKKWDNNFPRY